MQNSREDIEALVPEDLTVARSLDLPRGQPLISPTLLQMDDDLQILQEAIHPSYLYTTMSTPGSPPGGRELPGLVPPGYVKPRLQFTFPPGHSQATTWTLEPDMVQDMVDPLEDDLRHRNTRGRHGAQLNGQENLHQPREMSQPVEQETKTEATGPTATPRISCLLSSPPLPVDNTPVLGRIQTSQWRPIITNPEPETADERITRILQTALQGLTDTLKSNKVPSRPTFPRFEGSEWEDPKEFLTTMMRLYQREGIPVEDWVAFTGDQLRGEAFRWFEPYRSLQLNFQEFRRRFLGRFDNDGVRSQLQARLFGEKQRGESAAVFISRKISLYRRLMPEITEEVQINQIRVLLDPQIRLSIRGANTRTIDDLIDLATNVEIDLAEMYPPTRAAGGTPAIRARNPNVQAIQGGTAIPPSPCRFCQGSHFHRDCPRRPNYENPRPRPLAIEGPSNRTGNETQAERR